MIIAFSTMLLHDINGFLLTPNTLRTGLQAIDSALRQPDWK
jgi:hypothetical protein